MNSPIYIFQNNRQEGPFTREQVQLMLAQGAIAPITLMWREGMPGWAPLFTILQPPPIGTIGTSSPSHLLAPSTYGPAVARVASTQVVPSQGPSRSQPRGVGGWLLFFCIQLVVLGPLFNASVLIAAYGPGAAIYKLPGASTVAAWESASTLALTAYGIFVGCRVWRGDSDGRHMARTYLIVRGALAILAAMVTTALAGSALAPGGAVSTVITREVIYASLWWMYFKKSKRVRATYGDEH